MIPAQGTEGKQRGREGVRVAAEGQQGGMWISEFEGSLDYTARSRTAKNPASKEGKPKTQNRNTSNYKIKTVM